MPASAVPFKIKRGDTNPVLAAQLLDAKSKPIPLDDVASVDFHMKNKLPSGSGHLNAPAVVTDDVKALVEYRWTAGDTDDDGNYDGEFQINFSDGSVMTVPNDGYIDIVVLPDIDT